ncbi:MAG: TlpA family protein disulfide reductase [Vampirovibrionales bacterium]|nr:TlpA family protein disulfide reductase [Vampirovibrionales bacterium]
MANLRYALLSFTVLLLVGILVYGGSRAIWHGPKAIENIKAEKATDTALLPLGSEAPNFILPGTDGKDYHLRDYRGQKLVLVEIFASWCPHCQASVSALKTLYKQYGDTLEILSINAGDKPPMKSTSQEFKAAFGVPYPILEEPSDSLMAAYKLSSYPTMYLVDKQGKIIYAHNGELHPSQSAEIGQLLLKAKQ